MKFLNFSAFSFLVIHTHGYQANFSVPKRSESANESLSISASELSRRICSQYSTPSNFCERLAEAIEQAEDDVELLAVPSKLSSSSRPRAAATKLLRHTDTKNLSSPLPTNLDVSQESAWDITKSPRADDRSVQSILDAVLGLINTPTPDLASGVALMIEFFFGQEKDLITELKESMQASVLDSDWQPIEAIILDAKESLTLLRDALAGDETADEVIALWSSALIYGEERDLFRPSGSDATFFPLYITWAAIWVIGYQAFLCDPLYPTLLDEIQTWVLAATYDDLLDDLSSHSASVESAYNTWFLGNQKYLNAAEIRNHFLLRFAFDYAQVVGSLRGKCDFTTTEALAPASYSAIPLFGDSILDTRGDDRAGLLSEFFSAAMAYAMPKRKLKSLGVYPDYWDNEGVSFSGVEMWYEDSGPEQYGDITNEDSHWWNLEVSGALCKVRGMRYEFGVEADGMVEYVLDGEGQSYRLKECWNKFQADVECNAITVEWKMGDVFHTPNVVIASANTRVFHKFVGWKTENYDAEIYSGNFLGTYPIWVAPRGHDHLLDNLLVVYRMDSSDYSNLNTKTAA